MLLPFDTSAFTTETAILDRWAKKLDRRVLARRWEGRLRRALEAEAVAASTRMEGVPVTVDDALRILAGDPPESVSVGDQALVRGYRDAMTYAQRRADDGLLIWNRELIVSVQDRVLAGDFATGSGRLRTGPTWITNTSSGETVFEPPEGERVPALVDEMCDTIERADWHPAVATAWLHVSLAAIHPFRDGNGRTARVLASLTMYRGGFKDPAFTSLEEWWGRNTSTYYDAFNCLGTQFSPAADVTPFIKTHVMAHVAQVAAVALRQRVDGRLWTTIENALEDRGLPARLANALYDSFYERDVTSAYYRDLIDASQGTARNDLQAAAAAGLLTPVGRTRGRRYTPGPSLFSALATTLGGTDPSRKAIMNELLLRSAADWNADKDLFDQEPLPGLGS
jgi:Fic family protein